MELKQVTLGIKEPFRGKAPVGPLKDEDVVEFNDPAVRVERIVCAATVPCLVKAEEAGSLLVAFTPMGIAMSASGKLSTMEAGGVLWLGSGQARRITGEVGVPRQVLRILLPGAGR